MKRALVALPLLLLLAACEQESATAPDTQEPAATVELDDAAPALTGNNAYAHCAAICDLGPRPSGSQAYAKQLDYLGTHLEKAGWSVQKRDFKLTDGTVMTNLHATFGSAEGTRPLILTCHIDTKRLPGFIGADDGASAAALMLELARVLAREPQKATRIELIFFDGEESFYGRMNRENSLFGSRFEVFRRRLDMTLPKWQINLDMVGGRDKMTAVPVMDTPTEMVDHYLRAIEALGYPDTRWTLYPGSYLDDHTPFDDAGVPTLNLIAHFQGSNWWHTNKDTMQRISPSSLEETGKLVLQLLRQILGE